jgi:PST family polysaccharide transporter
MAFTPFITSLSNVFGLQAMLPFGMKSEFSVILAGSGVINILIMAILVTQFGGAGAAVATTLTQILITAAMAAILYIKKESIMHTEDLVIPMRRVNLLRDEGN